MCVIKLHAFIYFLRPPPWSGTIRVQWFFNLTMLNVVLNWHKISKTILEKAFFFILWNFYIFLVFVSKLWKTALLRGEIFFLEIGHTGYRKIENFMQISKKQTCLSDKIPLIKVKELFSYFAKSHFFVF